MATVSNSAGVSAAFRLSRLERFAGRWSSLGAPSDGAVFSWSVFTVTAERIAVTHFRCNISNKVKIKAV